MSDKNDFGLFVLGFTVGALAGAVTSLLLAPQSGEDTRQFIKDKAIELKDKAADSYEDTKLKAEKAYEEAKIKAEELVELTKKKAEEIKEKGQVVVEEQREKIAETIAPKKTAKK